MYRANLGLLLNVPVTNKSKMTVSGRLFHTVGDLDLVPPMHQGTLGSSFQPG